MVLTLSAIAALVRLVQFSNAPLLMVVTLFGIVTLVRLAQSLNE